MAQRCSRYPTLAQPCCNVGLLLRIFAFSINYCGPSTVHCFKQVLKLSPLITTIVVFNPFHSRLNHCHWFRRGSKFRGTGFESRRFIGVVHTLLECLECVVLSMVLCTIKNL